VDIPHTLNTFTICVLTLILNAVVLVSLQVPMMIQSLSLIHDVYDLPEKNLNEGCIFNMMHRIRNL
jgi:hypothetical protein